MAAQPRGQTPVKGRVGSVPRKPVRDNRGQFDQGLPGFRRSRSRLISAPSSRCGSNGTSRTARQRREKWSTTFCDVDLARSRPHRVDHRDGVTHQLLVAVRVEPVQRRRRAAGTVDRTRTHDDQGVGVVQHRRHRRVHQAGAAVGEHQAVEPLEHLECADVVVGTERLRHRGITLARPAPRAGWDPARCSCGRRCSARCRRRRAADGAPSPGSPAAPSGSACRGPGWRPPRSPGRRGSRRTSTRASR